MQQHFVKKFINIFFMLRIQILHLWIIDGWKMSKRKKSMIDNVHTIYTNTACHYSTGTEIIVYIKNIC